MPALWLALAGCPKKSAPEAPVPAEPAMAAANWFDVEPGKPLCVSLVPDAEPLPEDAEAALTGAYTAILEGDPDKARAGLEPLPDHPAVGALKGLLGLLMGEEGSADALIALSEAHPADPCLNATAALAAASIHDPDRALAAQLRARQAAPDDPNVALVSWVLGTEPPDSLLPQLEQGLETQPQDPGFALAVGLSHLDKGDIDGGVALMERALQGGMVEAAAILLIAYREQGSPGHAAALASRIGLYSDGGALAQAEDPEAAYRTALGIGEGQVPQAVFHTSKGDLACRLMPEVAPIAVGNFVGLARGTAQWKDPRTGALGEGPLYDGTVFHRVIPEFMIQGGDPAGTGRGDIGFVFPNEVTPEVRFDVPGRLALANAGPNTNSSQFFVTEVPVDRLDGQYTIFGTCDEAAVKVASKIARVETDDEDRPVEPVTLESVEITAVAAPPPAPAADEAPEAADEAPEGE
ncbi:MAG: peptidylprolyl isomerase [Myxococcota bacterium]